MTNKQDRKRSTVLTTIPGCDRESGPDVLWVTPGGSGDFRGHVWRLFTLLMVHSWAKTSESPWPLPLWPNGTCLLGMLGNCYSLFNFLSFRFSVIASRCISASAIIEISSIIGDDSIALIWIMDGSNSKSIIPVQKYIVLVQPIIHWAIMAPKSFAFILFKIMKHA